MKIRLKQAAGATLAGLVLMFALAGHQALEQVNHYAANGAALVALVCLFAGLLDTGTGRHKKGGR
jgi:hypothetical protein